MQASLPRTVSVVCRVDVDDPAAGDTLESLHAAGAETLRIRNFHRSPGNDPLAIWRRVADLGMSVSVGGSAEGFASPEFAELVGSLPNLTVIIEHLAGMGIYAIGADSMPSDDVFRAALTLSRFDNTAIKIHGMGEISDRRSPIPIRLRTCAWHTMLSVRAGWFGAPTGRASPTGRATAILWSTRWNRWVPGARPRTLRKCSVNPPCDTGRSIGATNMDEQDGRI